MDYVLVVVFSFQKSAKRCLLVDHRATVLRSSIIVGCYKQSIGNNMLRRWVTLLKMAGALVARLTTILLAHLEVAGLALASFDPS